MGTIVKYNPDSEVVANRVIGIKRSVNTPDYVGLPNTLINPEIPEIPQSSMKVDGSEIVELSQAEKDAIAAAAQQAKTDAVISMAEALESKVENVLVALVKVINVRIPSNPITKAEVVAQLKEDLGVA